MDELLKILKPYNIFTSLYPGYLFAIFCEESIQNYIVSIHEKSVILGMCFCYFVGTLINKIGSLILEWGVQKIKFVKFASYENYISATRKDKKIELFSAVNNTYRSLCALFGVLFIMNLIVLLPQCILDLIWNKFFFFATIFLIMIFAYRKQTEYVVKRVNKALENEN